MLELYSSLHFELLKSWITDEELLFRFSGTDFTYPISEQQIVDYQLKYPERRFYMGYTPGKMPFAFGEIIPQESGVPRLGRILVGDPALRGKGLGRYFIKLLIGECSEQFLTKRVELLTWDMNHTAIRCYESVGFVYDALPQKVLKHQGRLYNIHKMTFTFE